MSCRSARTNQASEICWNALGRRGHPPDVSRSRTGVLPSNLGWTLSVEHTHDRIIVTRNGRPAAVLISPEELASLEDTLELLSDPDAMRELDESRQAYAADDFVTGEELRSRYLAK